MLAAASNAVIRALLAPSCAACDRPLDDPLSGTLCLTCWRDWPALTPPTCMRCGDQLAAWRPPGDARDGWCDRCQQSLSSLSCIRSAGAYDGSLRHMIHALKYRKRRMIAPVLARRMRTDCAEALAGADAVVPIPMHWWRLWDRGFNQADDIAIHLGVPVWRALRRQRGGPPQASLPAAARFQNAEGAYAVARAEPFRGTRRRPRLVGASLVLVDDVVTTGATLEACAAILVAAGATRVTAVTAARAVAAPRRQRPPGPRLFLVPRQ
jgi:ComF family protein